MPLTSRGHLKGVALLCVGLALSGCTTLGPDYQEPEVGWLDEWETALYGQLGTPEAQSEIDLRFWWRLFDDPALNQLIELAKQENPSLRIAGLRILESRAQLGIAGSARYPQVQQIVGAVDYVSTKQRGGGTCPPKTRVSAVIRRDSIWDGSSTFGGVSGAVSSPRMRHSSAPLPISRMSRCCSVPRLPICTTPTGPLSCRSG